MFIDTRRLDEGSAIEAEVCIIGGGVAGITVALELEKRGTGTCLIESGGFKPDNATKDLYRGESIGLPYIFADGCRSRFLGGSSNCWGGWCRPMEEQDFVRREWVPNSGWPFAKSKLQPYYERTHGILRLGPNRFDTDFWVDAIVTPRFAESRSQLAGSTMESRSSAPRAFRQTLPGRAGEIETCDSVSLCKCR
jgi:choline dehydrogenase-like flavoprotein